MFWPLPIPPAESSELEPFVDEGPAAGAPVAPEALSPYVWSVPIALLYDCLGFVAVAVGEPQETRE